MKKFLLFLTFALTAYSQTGCVGNLKTASSDLNSNLGGGVTCSLDGVILQEGQSHNFSNTVSVPDGQTCSYVTRTCQHDGTYSGNTSYNHASCTVLPPDGGGSVSCTLDSVTRLEGQSYTFFNVTSVPNGQTCTTHGLSRTCQHSGSYSGDTTYNHATCSVQPPSGSTLFPADTIWYKDVTTAVKHPESDTIINWLASNGGWGTGHMQVDFTINLMRADASTPRKTIVDHPDYGYYTPDCNSHTQTPTIPVPTNGAIEGQDGLTCDDDGDCHFLVVDSSSHKVYEAYQANVSGNNFQSSCVIAWDQTYTYPQNMRGDGCTSVDAAGFPISALLVTADEVATGSVNHAIRFILPNARMQRNVYFYPASHYGGPSGPANAVPYGSHFRLKSTFNVSSLKPSAQIIARAMQKYGMFLADGGNIALTFANDRFTTAKWSTLDFQANDLSTLQVTDFEIVKEYDGQRHTGQDCTRNNAP